MFAAFVRVKEYWLFLVHSDPVNDGGPFDINYMPILIPAHRGGSYLRRTILLNF